MGTPFLELKFSVIPAEALIAENIPVQINNWRKSDTRMLKQSGLTKGQKSTWKYQRNGRWGKSSIHFWQMQVNSFPQLIINNHPRRRRRHPLKGFLFFNLIKIKKMKISNPCSPAGRRPHQYPCPGCGADEHLHGSFQDSS